MSERIRCGWGDAIPAPFWAGSDARHAQWHGPMDAGTRNTETKPVGSGMHTRSMPGLPALFGRETHTLALRGLIRLGLTTAAALFNAFASYGKDDELARG